MNGFKWINTTIIFQCILVCKNWKSTAQRIAYTDIYVCDREQFEMLQEAMLHNKLLGRNTNSLNYRIDDFSLDEFRSISSMFPFLKKLWPIYGPYSKNFHDRITAIHTESRFLYLESFPARYEETDDSYLNYILEYRHTLRNIEFTTFFDHDEQHPLYIFAMTHLKDFANLTELCVSNSSEDFFDESETPYSIILYDSIIDERKNLKTFRLVHISTLENITPEQWQMIKPQPNVRYLYLDRCSPENDNFLSYIQFKFTNLKKFVSKGDENFETLISDRLIFADAIIEFANYFSTIPENYVKYFFGKGYEKLQVMSQLWNLLPNYQMRESVEIRCKLSCSFSEFLYSEHLEMKKPGSLFLDMNISYHTHRDDNYTSISVEYLIIKSGQNIRYLTIKGDKPIDGPKSTLHLLKFLAFKY